MPLSDHEQRLLEQIEQALAAEDPKFANIYRSNDLRSHYRRRLLRAGILVVIGLGALLAGVITKLIPLGVGGFLLMLVGVTFAVASWQRMSGPRRPAAAPVAAAPKPRRSVVKRLEDRWQRRIGDR